MDNQKSTVDTSSKKPDERKRKTTLRKVVHTYHAITYDKRVQRLVMLSSLLLAMGDLASDWSVAINYLIRANEKGISNKDKTIFTTYSAIFIIFFAFHGIVGLGYHISESKELRNKKKEEMSQTMQLKQLQSISTTNVTNTDTNNTANNTNNTNNASAVAISSRSPTETASNTTNTINVANGPTAVVAVNVSDTDIIGTNGTPTTQTTNNANKTDKIDKIDSMESDINDSNTVESSDAIVTEASYWQYPFFLVGLGTVAACWNCFKVGRTDQLWEENRYFEILFESIPMGCITFYALLEQRDYSNEIILISVIISVLSVGYGTGWYFARHYSKGNPLEFKPLVESSYLYIELGLLTSLDYIVRVVSPLLLIRSNEVSDNSPLVLPLLFLFIVFSIPEIIGVTCIHGSFAKFGGPFGWFATFSVSVPIFAGIATRFEHYTSFWMEIIIRNLVNIACVALAVYFDYNDKNSKDLEYWISILSICFILSNIMTVHLIYECKKVIDNLPVPRTKSILGTRNTAAGSSVQG